MKTRIIRYGAVARDAQCFSCDWGLNDDGNQNGYRAIARHVAKTGHRVSIETTTYSECIPMVESKVTDD